MATTSEMFHSIVEQVDRFRAMGLSVDGIEISTYDYDRIINMANEDDAQRYKFRDAKGRQTGQFYGTSLIHNANVTPGVARIMHSVVIDADAPPR